MRWRAWWCAVLLFWQLPGLGHAACLVQAAATVPLDIAGATILVTVQVNDQPATFVLDTGAQRSVVTEAAAQRLHLARDPWVGTTMRGVGGIERRPNADPRSLTLGGVALVRRTLNHDTSLTVGVLPRATAGGQGIDGLLGRDFLSAFDLDLDVPAKRLTLYRVDGCTGSFLPWRFGYTAVPVTMPIEQAVVMPVVLDGMGLRALLDTGSGSSLLAAPGLYRLGLQPAALAQDRAVPVTGLGPRPVMMRQHRFHTLVVAGQAIRDPVLWVAPVRLTPIVDMLLGADWLASRRVWISFTTRQVFVATAAKGD
ncbi:MAG TPA: retroviral-like aspartic protease family protein [Rhodopila sp.]|nr:retroviral-like aspartic protease family protein [Rhodopila sp.]